MGIITVSKKGPRGIRQKNIQRIDSMDQGGRKIKIAVEAFYTCPYSIGFLLVWV